jgi:hypothetical protein
MGGGSALEQKKHLAVCDAACTEAVVGVEPLESEEVVVEARGTLDVFDV